MKVDFIVESQVPLTVMKTKMILNFLSQPQFKKYELTTFIYNDKGKFFTLQFEGFKACERSFGLALRRLKQFMDAR